MEECTLLEQLKSRGGNKIRKAAKLFYVAMCLQNFPISSSYVVFGDNKSLILLMSHITVVYTKSHGS